MSKLTSKYSNSKGPVVDVYVKLTSGRNVQYDVDPDILILTLLDMVAKDEGVPSRQVKLKYQGKVLIATKTVRDYGVRAETILKATIVVPKSLALVIHLPGDEVEEVTVSNLDTTQSLFQIVTDKTGVRPPKIELKCKGQKLTSSSATLMDAGIENCSEIHVTYKEETTEAKKDPNPGATEVMDDVEKEAVLSSFQTDGRQVEVVFSFDTTGSMYQYLQQVRTKLRECCTRLLQDIPNIRIGLMAHGDYCDQDTYVIRSVDLTDDVDTLVSFADDVPSTSGGDCPECYEWVLRKSQHLDWSEDSAKALVVIGDLYPHEPSYTDQNIRWRDELDILKGMGVKVYGVQAGTNREASNFYAEIADLTEGRHLKLSHFDIITDMFLAVCYREGNEEMLEEFEQELEGAGRMTEQTKVMFEQLKETDEEKKKKKEEEEGASASTSKRYVAQEWWDHSLVRDGKTPSYVYDAQTDKWSVFRGPSVAQTITTTIRTSITPRSSSSKSSRGRRCSIM